MLSQWAVQYLLPLDLVYALVPPEWEAERVAEDQEIHLCHVLVQILYQSPPVHGHVPANDLSTNHSSFEDLCPAIDHRVPRIHPLSGHMMDLSPVAADRPDGLFGLVHVSEVVDEK
jgi:hypothetical protein